MSIGVVIGIVVLAFTVTQAAGQVDDDLARRLRDAQERLDRANAALQGLPQPSTQFDPNAVRRLDQDTAREKARIEAEQAAAQEKAREEWERNRPRTTTCQSLGRNFVSCTTR